MGTLKLAVSVNYATAIKIGFIILAESLLRHWNILRNNLSYALLKGDLVLHFKAEATIIKSWK